MCVCVCVCVCLCVCVCVCVCVFVRVCVIHVSVLCGMYIVLSTFVGRVSFRLFVYGFCFDVPHWLFTVHGTAVEEGTKLGILPRFVCMYTCAPVLQ